MHFAEQIVHIVRAVDRGAGAAGAGEVAALSQGVGHIGRGFFTIFAADRNAHPVLGVGALDPVIAQLAVDVQRRHALGRGALGEGRRFQIVQSRLGHAASHPRIVGLAGAARDTDRNARGVVDHLQRILDPAVQEVTGGRGLQDRGAVQQVAVIAPRLVQITLHAEQDAIFGVTDVVGARTAFNVTTANIDRHGTGHIVAGVRRGDLGRRTHLGQHRRRDLRVVTVDEITAADRRVRSAAEEDAARRDLGDRIVICEHDLRIDVRLGVDLIVRKGAEGVTLVRTLEVVDRTEIIGVHGAVIGREGAVRAKRHAGEFARGRGDVAETTGEGGGRTRAGQAGAAGIRQGAGRIVAIAFHHRVDLAIGGVGGHIALAVRRIGANDRRHFIAATVRHAARRQRIVVRGVRGLTSGIAVVMLVGVVIDVQLHALEVLDHHEVDDTGHSVCAVVGRGAARLDVDPVNQGAGNEVDVGGAGARIARNQTAAVDQNKRTAGAQTAQVDRRRARGAVGDGRALRGEGLRQGVDDVFNAGRALRHDVGVRHHRNGAGRLQVRLWNARTGHHNSLNIGRSRVRCLGGARQGHCGADNAGGQQALAHGGWFHVLAPEWVVRHVTQSACAAKNTT